MLDAFWNSELGKTLTDSQKQIELWAKVQIGLLASILIVLSIALFKKR